MGEYRVDDIKFALVEWKDEQEQKWSIVSIDQIRNFCVSNFVDGISTGEELYLVEWREGKRPHPVYLARVLHVASK